MGRRRKTHYTVESILEKRIRLGITEYLLKWEGYGPEENQWVRQEYLQCPELVAEFEKSLLPPGSEAVTSSETKEEEPARLVVNNNIMKPNRRQTGSSKASSSDSEGGKSSSTTSTGKKRVRKWLIDQSDDELEQSLNGNNSNASIVQATTTEVADIRDVVAQSDTMLFPNDASYDLEPEKVIGATMTSHGRMMVIKWKGTERVELVTAEEANLKWPQLVIKFYEDKSIWN